MSLVARSEYAVHQLMKRKNWAQREPGVIVVLVIVFLVFLLVIAMFINKRVRLHLPPHFPPKCQPQNKQNKSLTPPHRRTQSQSPHKIPDTPTERDESNVRFDKQRMRERGCMCMSGRKHMDVFVYNVFEHFDPRVFGIWRGFLLFPFVY
jgi:hypothetical protein